VARSILSKDFKALKTDLREFLYPLTAKTFNDSPSMKLKEILSYASTFAIKNLFFLSAKERGNYLKLLAAP
jgi:hypothetical protein